MYHPRPRGKDGFIILTRTNLNGYGFTIFENIHQYK